MTMDLYLPADYLNLREELDDWRDAPSSRETEMSPWREYEAARAPDEGTAAHLFQLLMAVQLPIVAVFATRYLPRATWPALRVLILQAAAGLAAMAPVFY